MNRLHVDLTSVYPNVKYRASTTFQYHTIDSSRIIEVPNRDYDIELITISESLSPVNPGVYETPHFSQYRSGDPHRGKILPVAEFVDRTNRVIHIDNDDFIDVDIDTGGGTT